MKKPPATEEMAPLFPGVDPTSLETLLHFLYAGKSMILAMESFYAQHHLSFGKLRIMQLLQEQPSGLAPSELADALGVTRATITGLLDGLERAGWLQRDRDPQDRRKQVLKLTEAGRSFFADFLPVQGRWMRQVLTILTPDEGQQLDALSQKLLRGLSRQVPRKETP